VSYSERFPRQSYFTVQFQIVDKKEILLTLSNTGIYCSSDKVGTVAQYNTFSKIPPSTLMHFETRVRTVYGISAYSAFAKMPGIFHDIPTMSLSTVTTANWHFITIHMREARTILGAKSKLLHSETALPRNRSEKDTCKYTLFCLKWPILYDLPEYWPFFLGYSVY
jgi:hypothetical protein